MTLIHSLFVFFVTILMILFSLFMIYVYDSGDHQTMSVSTLNTHTVNHVLSSNRLKQKEEKQSIRRHRKRDINALDSDVKALDSNTYLESNGSNVGNDGFPVKGHTCKSINVRNNVSDLSSLRGCTVVEGSVMIALIEKAEPEQFENFTFPELREITDYLVIFRVYNLHTLEKLFPNLTVIRGIHLFHDNAIVFRNTSLKEIGLKKLKHIMRGTVRIDRNPYLCFADTIDWNVIAKYGKNSHIINNNKDYKLCQNQSKNCAKHCPMKGYRTEDGQYVGDLTGRLCWSANVCQSVCDQSCEDTTGTCYANNSSLCCGLKCLGGCKELDIDENGFKGETCDVCRFIFRNNISGEDECVKQCPRGTYEYLNRHCFTASECVAKSESEMDIELKPFNGKCIHECPRGYEEQTDDKNKCVPCKGISCSKKCDSRELSNIATIQSIEGCTIITGNLVINIDTGGSNVIRELEKSLKHLQEIRGYLKIFHSSQIVNLNFLANLRVVHGDTLERQHYSFYVVDNPNLQDLWPERNQTGVKLEFLKGKLFMHMNPRLCYSNIKMMDSYAKFVARNESSWDIHDVGHTNGDKTACNLTKLELKIIETNANSIVITFQNFNPHINDYRKLLGYLVNYKEAPFKNVSLYEDNNPCTSTWIVKDIGSINDTDEDIMYEISSLQPFTQYVFYVKTYTTSSEDKGAQSDLIYFMTESDTPSHPLSLESKTVSDSEIYVEWKPPNSPNGIIGYYVVNVYQIDHNFSGNMGQTRNYCQNPISFDIQRDTKISEDSKKAHLKYLQRNNITADANEENDETPENKQCCRCDTIPQIIMIKNEEAERQIGFENYLINAVYKKRNDTLRKKRDVTESGKYLGLSFKASHNVEINTSLTIPDLKHYTQYLIEVIACHNDPETATDTINTIETTTYGETTTLNTNSFETLLTDTDKTETTTKQLSNLFDPKQYDRCSRSTNDIAYTLPIPSADNMDEYSVTDYNQNNTIIISWDEPYDPNGYIVSYNIEYQSHIRKSQSHRNCITRVDFTRNNNSYQIVDLLPGNYSYRLQANSIAGSGNWTKQYFFIVFEPPTDTNWVTVLIILAVVGCLCFIGVFLYCYHSIQPNNDNKLDYVSINPGYHPFPAIKPDPKWDVPRTAVDYGESPIGEGRFSQVYEGSITKDNAKIKCAVKVIKDGSQSNTQFLKEAQKMKKLSDCDHVVKLLGIVTSDSREQPILVLIEYMANSDLRNYLSNFRKQKTPPDMDKLAQMAIEIADGMAYLEDKKCVHGDLAARNCLVSEDLTVKISDFGLSHNLENDNYYIIESDDEKTPKVPLPVRWMSPESLLDFPNVKYSTASDIWSYGVVLWEIVTLGRRPYPCVLDDMVISFIKRGNTMELPKDCPHFMWDIISSCWLSSNQRPSFKEIVEKLLPFRDKRFDEVSYYFKNMKSAEPQLCASLSDNSYDPLLTDENELRLFGPENYINGEERKFIFLNSSIHDKLNDMCAHEAHNEISEIDN